MARRHGLCSGSGSRGDGEREGGATRCVDVVIVGLRLGILGRVAHVVCEVGLVFGTIWVVVLIEGLAVSGWELDSELVVRMRICNWGETQHEEPRKPGYLSEELYLQFRCHKEVAQAAVRLVI